MAYLRKKELKEKIRKAFYVGLGSGFVVVGLVSLLFPVIPGVVLILFGSLCLVQGSERLYEHSVIRKLVVSAARSKN